MDFDDGGGTIRFLRKEAAMEVIHRRCAGLDVHKKSVVGCVRVAEGRKVRRETRQFGG